IVRQRFFRISATDTRHHLSATLPDLRVETTGPGGFDAVAIARAAVSECGLSAGFRTPAMTRPATCSEPAKTERAKYRKNPRYWITTAEPMEANTCGNCPLPGIRSSVLGRDQAARDLQQSHALSGPTPFLTARTQFAFRCLTSPW